MSIPANPALSPQDKQALQWLLRDPGPAIAWAQDLSTESFCPERSPIALAVLLHDFSEQSVDLQTRQHNARLRALGAPLLKDALLAALPELWARQQTLENPPIAGKRRPVRGLAAWLDAIMRARDNGATAEDTQCLAAKAMDSPLLWSLVEDLGQEGVDALALSMAGCQGSPDELLAQCASRMSPKAAARMAIHCYFDVFHAFGKTLPSEVKSRGPLSAKALALRALSEPRSARLLVQHALLAGARGTFRSGREGLFEALAESASQELHPKAVDTDLRDIAVPAARNAGLRPAAAAARAIEFADLSAPEPFKACLAWAVALGYKGGRAAAKITDGYHAYTPVTSVVAARATAGMTSHRIDIKADSPGMAALLCAQEHAWPTYLEAKLPLPSASEVDAALADISSPKSRFATSVFTQAAREDLCQKIRARLDSARLARMIPEATQTKQSNADGPAPRRL